jgi:hypothetical protein
LSRRALVTRGVSVLTTILGAAGMAQEATSPLAPSTSTRHILHAPVGAALFIKQSVGMSIPLRCVTWRIVSPGKNVNSCPLIKIIFSGFMPHPSVEIVHPFRFSKELQETAVSESSL